MQFRNMKDWSESLRLSTIFVLLLASCSTCKRKSTFAPEVSNHKAYALLIGVEYFDSSAYKRQNFRYNYNNGATSGSVKDLANFKSIIAQAGVPKENITELLTRG